ncbi:MAG: bifunctional phosphoribosylaminoimidazolecarboxamide formyltransferase/IMP cyclohydrolase [Pseudomonadota bacterium]
MADAALKTETNKIPDSKAVKIKRAVLSVSDKVGLVEFAKKLSAHGIEILSTGGTAKAISEAGITVKDISDHTGFPEIMNGRVKTLHPKVHGGILSRRNDDNHVQAQKDHEIGDIDLVVVNLYPFAQTVADNADYETCIENIDIGGPAMIRAAAKNHEFVTVVTNPKDYDLVIDDLEKHDGCTTFSTRQKLALSAYSLTSTYDSNIATWFHEQVEDKEFPSRISFSGTLKQTLRYGENPHQQAALYKIDGDKRAGITDATQIQGKELSYNNINDTDAAFELVSEFYDPAVAIIKHANPCGVASSENILHAYNQALLCDPVSAFGGIIALNRTLTAETAQKILEVFSEVIIAPDVEAKAFDILKTKPNVRVLTTGAMPNIHDQYRVVKRVAGGLLVQDNDFGSLSKENLNVVSEREPTEEELQDMCFAFKVAKHVKSNAIVYAKDSATVGIGAGQMNRLDSSRIAARKGLDAAEKAGLEESLTKGSVVASDAFFPFADGLIAAAEAGVTAVIQPGGSIRDEEVIKAADERGLAMIFTGMRHFRH